MVAHVTVPLSPRQDHPPDRPRIQARAMDTSTPISTTAAVILAWQAQMCPVCRTEFAAGGLVQVGCMAHARRKFSEAVKGQGKNKRQGKAQQGLAWIQKLSFF